MAETVPSPSPRGGNATLGVVNLMLTEEQASYLEDIVTWWIDGHEDAYKATMGDTMLDSPETLLQAVAGLHEQVQSAVAIRTLLRGELYE